MGARGWSPPGCPLLPAAASSGGTASSVPLLRSRSWPAAGCSRSRPLAVLSVPCHSLGKRRALTRAVKWEKLGLLACRPLVPGGERRPEAFTSCQSPRIHRALATGQVWVSLRTGLPEGFLQNPGLRAALRVSPPQFIPQMHPWPVVPGLSRDGNFKKKCLQ